MQVLHAVTSPGDTIVMSAPTFDGYPIFAQMARLRSVTVNSSMCMAITTFDAMAATPRPGPGWWSCAGRTTRPEPSRPLRTSNDS